MNWQDIEHKMRVEVVKGTIEVMERHFPDLLANVSDEQGKAFAQDLFDTICKKMDSLFLDAGDDMKELGKALSIGQAVINRVN